MWPSSRCGLSQLQGIPDMADPGRRKFQGVLRFLVLCSTLRFTFKSRVYLEFRFLLSFFPKDSRFPHHGSRKMKRTERLDHLWTLLKPLKPGNRKSNHHLSLGSFQYRAFACKEPARHPAWTSYSHHLSLRFYKRWGPTTEAVEWENPAIGQIWQFFFTSALQFQWENYDYPLVN